MPAIANFETLLNSVRSATDPFGFINANECVAVLSGRFFFSFV